MRTVRILLPVLVLAACASTPQQREMQYIEAIKTAQSSIVSMLDYQSITPEQGEAAQAATRTATVALREAIQKRRSGMTDYWDAILATVEKALLEATRILEGRDK